MIYLVNASPNREGNSVRLGRLFLQGRDFETLHLTDYHIEQYGQQAEEDQFQQVFDQLRQADAWVFASPIYWWSFSGLLKTFMDRLADLPYPPEGLKGKRVYLLLQGSQPGKELELLDYAMNRFCRNYGLSYQGLAVTNYELEEQEGWDLSSLQAKLP